MAGVTGWVGVLFLAVISVGCAAKQQQRAAPTFKVAQAAITNESKYSDPELGFEIVRPSGDWQLDALDEKTAEGVSIPVVLRHRETGAQVVVQIAPAVATPTQFAERLTDGLRQQPGFTATDPEPLGLSERAVGFNFAAGEKVQGRVAVREGSAGRVFMLLATWPTNVAEGVPSNIDQIFESVKPI